MTILSCCFFFKIKLLIINKSEHGTLLHMILFFVWHLLRLVPIKHKLCTLGFMSVLEDCNRLLHFLQLLTSKQIDIKETSTLASSMWCFLFFQPVLIVLMGLAVIHKTKDLSIDISNNI